MRSHNKAYTSRRDPEPGNADARVGIVAQALSAHGLTIRSWAQHRGWATRSVYQVVRTWIEHPTRRGKTPLGGRYEAIARDLQATLGAKVVPLPRPDDRTLERVA